MIRPVVRLAEDWDGPALEALLKENGLYIQGLTWTGLRPFWLAAEHKGQIIGCAQVCPSRPCGHLAVLAVHPDYHNSGVGVHLLMGAEKLLANLGCQAYSMTTADADVLSMLARLGVYSENGHWLVYKRMTHGKD